MPFYTGPNAVVVAVNALGDVIDPQSGKIVAGARVTPASREFADSVIGFLTAS